MALSHFAHQLLVTMSIPLSEYSHASTYALLVIFFSLLSSLLLLLSVLSPTFPFRKAGGLNLRSGPRGLPLIGHLHLLGANPHRSLWELSKRYGALMLLRFGSVPVVVASSPSTARLILQTHDQIFAGRPNKAVPMQIVGCQDVAFSQPGTYWKLIRQLMATDLFGGSRLESFRPLIAEEIRALLCSIMSTADEVHLRKKLYEAVYNIISRMTLGKRVEELRGETQKDPSKDLMALALEFNELLGVFNVGDFIPGLAWMDLQGYVRRSKAVGQKVRAVLQEIINARKNLRAGKTSHGPHLDVDFLDVLLSAASSSSTHRKDIEMTDLHIIAILTDMFAAGIDTSTVTTEWALGELLRHPHIMQKVQDERQEVVGASRIVQASDIPHLPYLRAIVKETMRLHPSGPLLLPHMASRPCQIFGLDIPPNTQAYVNIWAIGRDPTIWNKPLEFYPERFLESNIDLPGQHFKLLPFGYGRRVCPGMVLGLNTVHLMLASLLHAFDWMALSEVDMSEKFGLVMTLAKPLVVKVMCKVPRHIIEAHI